MALVIPNQGESTGLSIFLGKTPIESLRLRLFTNNITPGESDTAVTYTEASGSGYASVLLTAANWVISAGDPTSGTYPAITFEFTGALGNVFGYYVTGETSGVVRWAERFDPLPFDVQAAGDQIIVTPSITLQDLLD